MKFINTNDKYEYRESKLPYRFERTIDRFGGDSLKEYEFFDGENVKWCWALDYISITSFKYTNTTPLFENVLLDDGKDRRRVLHKDTEGYGWVLRGRMNGSDVLCHIQNVADAQINKWFCNIENFGGKNVSISMLSEDETKVRVDYVREGINRIIIFDCSRFQACTNEVDEFYNNDLFLKSYKINGKIRIILGQIDSETREVQPISYDVSRGEFRQLIIDDYGMIDDERMIEALKNESLKFGTDIKTYKKFDKSYLPSFLKTIGIGHEPSYVINKIKEYNERERREKERRK